MTSRWPDLLHWAFNSRYATRAAFVSFLYAGLLIMNFIMGTKDSPMWFRLLRLPGFMVTAPTLPLYQRRSTLQPLNQGWDCVNFLPTDEKPIRAFTDAVQVGNITG